MVTVAQQAATDEVFTAPSGGGSFLAEDGTYPATIVGVTAEMVPEQTYNGKVKPERPGVRFAFAFHDEDDNWYVVTKRLPLSFFKTANMVKLFDALGIPIPADNQFRRGDVLGKQCLVEVDSYPKANGYSANGIAGFTSLPGTMRKAEAKLVDAAYAAYEEREARIAAWQAKQDIGNTLDGIDTDDVPF